MMVPLEQCCLFKTASLPTAESLFLLFSYCCQKFGFQTKYAYTIGFIDDDKEVMHWIYFRIIIRQLRR